MRLKWHFRDESENCSEVPVFNPKSRWQLPEGHPRLEVFLSQVENKLLELLKADIKYSNLSPEEWNVVRSLADDRNIIIKKADKGSCNVIWGRNDYLMEAQNQLSGEKVYQEVCYSKESDTVWFLMKTLCTQSVNEVSTWSAYNSLINEAHVKTTYCALPVLQGSPTDWSYLYTALKSAQNLNATVSSAERDNSVTRSATLFKMHSTTIES